MSSRGSVVRLALAFVFVAVAEARASQGPPPDGLILWLDASDASTVTVSGGLVSALANKAPGFSNSLTSAGTQRPLLISWPNSTSAVFFDGVDDVLKDDAYGQSPNELTLFVVTAPASNAGAFRGFFSGNEVTKSDFTSGVNLDQQDPSTAFDRVSFEGVKVSMLGGADLFSGSHPFGTLHVLQLDFWNVAPQLVVDGVPDGTLPAVSTADIVLDEIRIGARKWEYPNPNAGGAYERSYLHGAIGEVIVYERRLSSSESNEVGAYLTDKYGLTTSYGPVYFCTAKAGLACGLPVLTTAGDPDPTQSHGFFVFAGPARANRFGLVLYGNTGRNNAPFHGGTLCVNPPIWRTIVVSSGGFTTCDGEFSIDMNAFAAGVLGGNPQSFLVTPGNTVDAQWWGRDTPATGAFLSDAVEWNVQP